MVKGLSHYLRETWRKPKENLGPLWRERLMEWRRSDVFVEVDRPLRLDRARALGYKAKKGINIIRIRIGRGGRKRTRPIKKGRRSKRQGIRKVLSMNYKAVAEQRVSRKYPNIEVLNSYWIAKDGKNYWYEVIVVNPRAPEIRNDKQLGWIAGKNHRKRAMRGLTSAGKKGRGLHNRGKGAEKVRPSKRSQNKERRYKKSRAK